MALLMLLPACNRQSSRMEESGPPVSLQQDLAHHLVMENQYTRVYRVELPPGASTKLHRHDHDYVSVILTNAQLEGFSPGKPRTAAQREEGQVRFTPAGLIHGSVNTGKTTFGVLVVELLKPAGGDVGEPVTESEHSLDLGHGHIEDVVLNNSRVQATDLQIAPGMQTDEDAGVHPELLVWMADGELASGTSGEQLRGKKGEVSWLNADAGSLRNTGHHPAHLITVQFK